MLIGLLGLLGCRSGRVQPVALDSFREQAIYASLKKEAVPIPASTPYDSEARRRQFFDDGFRAGWDCAISGALLHGTFGTPVDLPSDTRDAWTAGWRSGTKTGSDRWQTEHQKLRPEIGQPDAGGNSR